MDEFGAILALVMVRKLARREGFDGEEIEEDVVVSERQRCQALGQGRVIESFVEIFLLLFVNCIFL